MKDTELSPYAALVLRLALGVMFLAHAGLKFFTFTLAGTAGFFESLGLPGFMAYTTFFAEIIIGSMLITGFYTRLAAAVAVPLLAGTILFVHGTAGWLFSNQGGGWEYPAFLMAAAVTQFLLGDGAFALGRTWDGALLKGDRELKKAALSAMTPLIK